MKPEAQRIAIAEACGWTQIRSDYRFACGITHSPGDGLVGISPINSSQGLTNPETCSWVVPDYLNSLDAMHEAVMALDGADRISFAAVLYDVAVPRDDRFDDHFIGWPQAELMINATAAQRAEAFLRTLNLWTDES